MLAKSLILLCIATFYVTDAQLTWTTPSGGSGTLTLAEDQASSTTVGTYTASGGTAPIIYSVVAGMPTFQIDSGTGDLSLSTALDFETATSHTVKIQAVDSTTGTALTSTATIAVTVTDVNEAAPVFAPSSYSKCLTDGTAAGTSVITVTATDADTGDTISYTITDGNTDNSFDIPTASSGLIQVNTGVTLSTTTASYDLEVTATDSASSAKSATVTVSITVAAACNNAQTLTWTNPNGGSGTLTLAEDQATSATVGTYTVTGGTGTVTYTVVAGNPPFQVDSSTGALSLSTALDYETAASHTVKVKAVDSTSGTPLSSTATITVTVTDVNEAPAFSLSSYSKCLTVGTAAGTSVITVTAADADTGDAISYAITGGNTDTSFNIPTASSGLIQVSTGVTLSATTASYDLEITASDDGSPVKSTTVTVSITVAAECSSATTTIVSMMLLTVAVFVTLF